MPPHAWPLRHSFTLKALLAASLVVLADLLFYGHDVGWTVGAFALALLSAAILAHRPRRNDLRAVVASLIALAFAATQVDQPTLIGLVLFICSLGVAILSRRAGRGDAWRWAQGLVFNAVAAPFRAPTDLLRLRKVTPLKTVHIPRAALALILPLGGGILFLWLFSLANPLIEQAFTRLFAMELALDPIRGVFWLIVLSVAWGVLRPRLLRRVAPTPGGEGDLKLPGITVGSIAMALAVFNLVFALQNGLDIAFLWSGAALPDGMTLASYAHRGAYPLIATALLAGLFVLVALAPGSASSRNRLIRTLVVLWVAQNVLLVASTMLRTIDYVEVYSLTRLRIAALAWMALVAVGLVLICWRMLRAKSSSWLINANVLAAGLVLGACSVADLGAVAAQWNVRHAAEAGGSGTRLDLCYLNTLGEAALVPLAQLEQRGLTPEFGDRVSWLRGQLMGKAEQKQDDWRAWTWRRAQRLAKAQAIARAGEAHVPLVVGRRQCDGAPAPRPPSAGVDAAQAPLTSLQPRQ